MFCLVFTIKCFNTQPPEGGWHPYCPQFFNRAGFNTQPPEGGWLRLLQSGFKGAVVSTHSRPKAAGPSRPT